MKKLLFWALLLTTGFALYSCDERFDNPVTGGETAQATTFTYEVGIKFADVDWNYWDADAEEYKNYEAPKTVYVYNEKFQLLGELKAKEDIVAGDFNKFSGKLTGEIGEKLYISSLKDFEVAGNLDGTWETVIKYGILMAGEAPIIIKNTVGNTIATKNVTLENKTTVAGLYLYNWERSNDKVLKVTAKGLLSPYATEEIEKEFTINLKEDVSFNNLFVIPVVAKEADEDDEDYEGIELKFNIDSENGYKSIGIWEHFMPDFDDFKGWYGISMQLTELDLTKYTAYLEDEGDEAPFNIFISTPQSSDNEPIIYQSGSESVNLRLTIRGEATLKDLNIEGDNSYINFSGYIYKYEFNNAEYNYLPTITLVGKNSIKSKEWSCVRVSAETTLKGEGELTIESNNYGIEVYNRWFTSVTSADYQTVTYTYYPTKLIIDGAKVTSNTGAYVSNTSIEGASTPNEIEVKNGTFIANGKETNNPAIYLNSGKLTILENGTVTATSGQTAAVTPKCIQNQNGEEVELKDIVGEDKVEKFSDTGVKAGVRTITKK